MHRMQDLIECASNQEALNALARELWAQWAAGQCSDQDAEQATALLESRRHALRDITAKTKSRGQVRPKSCFPRKPKRQRARDRQLSLWRRRQLAASGPLPPILARLFTTGELAALKIVADEIRERQDCRLTIAEIAARAGVSQTTARNALRNALRLRLLTIEERRRAKRPSLTNIVRVSNPAWSHWIKNSKKRMKNNKLDGFHGGCKKSESTDKVNYFLLSERMKSNPLQKKPKRPLQRESSEEYFTCQYQAL